MTTKELENYEPEGQLEGFPKEIIARMLECQKEQGNKKDISVFERDKEANKQKKGFNWLKTQEGQVFWFNVIGNRIFDVFFKKYPQQDNQYSSQEFRAGDEVINIINGRRGKVTGINTLNKDIYPLFVDFGKYQTTTFTLDGRSCISDKHPRLLHYRDDYNYDVIDFNNLPKRQEPKRWRAKKGEFYYAITAPAFKIGNYFDDYVDSDNEVFEIGNYFQTEEQAQEVADKLKEYFNQLIQEEHEHERI